MNTRRLLFTLIVVIGTISSGTPALAQQSDNTVDVRIWTQTADGQSVYDVCYELAGYSQVGCDENRDGNVLFEDIPYGEYNVMPTYPYGMTHTVEPFVISVNQSNTDFVAHVVNHPSAPQEAEGSTDILLLTRDPKTGDSLTDVCFELVGYSNVGCDDNADGRVRFADIPYGEYVIRQTHVPDGYPKMDDYVVSIVPTGLHAPFTILLSQSKTQAPQDQSNVSVVFYDSDTGSLITNAENCAQLWHGNDQASLVGCDKDIVDGQVDFMHTDFDPGAKESTLKADPVCGYRILQQSDLGILWVGQQTLVIYVPVSSETGANCR